MSVQLYALAALPPKEVPSSTLWIEDRVGYGASLDGVKKITLLALPELELRPLGSSASCQSLYLLSYPCSALISRKMFCQSSVEMAENSFHLQNRQSLSGNNTETTSPMFRTEL